MPAPSLKRPPGVLTWAGFVLVVIGACILSLATYERQGSTVCSLACFTPTFTVQPLGIGSAILLVWLAAIPLLFVLITQRFHLATVIGPALVLLSVVELIWFSEFGLTIVLSSAFWFLSGAALVICGSVLEIAGVVRVRVRQVRRNPSESQGTVPSGSVSRPAR